MVGRASFPANCGAAPARLVSGINRRKHEWCSDGAKYEVAIPAVPLRSVPTIDVKGKPEKSVSSHHKDYDKGPKIANTTDNTVHQKDESRKRESDKLAAVIAEAKESINLFDARNTSKDHQPPSLEFDAFHTRTSVGEQRVMMETVKLEKRARDDVLAKSVMMPNLDRSFSGKRLKFNSGISVIVQEEKASGTETMWEDSEDEVSILSPAEWNVLQRRSNHKDECAKPSIGKLEKKLERQRSLEFDKECRNVIDPISGGTKSDLPSERFPNCELTETKRRDCQEHGSTNLDECYPISEREQDDALKMFSVDDEAIATNSMNCNDEPEYCENHKELINLEIVQQDHPQRRKVTQALKLFKEEYEFELREGKNTKGPHLEAAKRVKAKGMNVSTDKPFGHIPGIEIGDEFSFRSELTIVGLNCQFTPGIDYVTLGGKQYATSVVNSGRYENEAKEDNILIYSGQGGNPKFSVNAADQKLERGNLALMNSMKMGYPVRVIHKRKCLMESKTLGMNNKRDYKYVYDGLYMVNRFWQDRENENCKLVFKFELQRLPGQPSSHGTDVELGKHIQATEVCDALQGKENFEVVNGLQGQPRSHGEDVCVLDDVSQGKEKFKVRVVNELDEDLPLPFTYITNIVYPPHWFQCHEPIGCNCIDGCSDSVQCPCVIKNGGEIPFTEKGVIMRARTNNVVHECGPSCKCPPSCMNRVSQCGPSFELEIFKTKSMGWGVRSRNYIMPGSFICEYIGELLGEKEANQRIGNDEYLFDICHGKSEKDDFALDAAKCGNIGRFINHSCNPNVFAQKVLYDNDDKRVPHIMFFAGKCIPPRAELRYDYNYSKICIRDANGNIKRKACHCGSRKCTGRLY